MITIVYDGQCPFCTAYTRLLRLRDNVGTVTLVDARDKNHPLVKEIRSTNIQLKDGMVVYYQNTMYHGADAMHLLSMLSAQHHIGSRLVQWVFSSPLRAKILYPILKAGRRITLFLIGRKNLTY